MTALWLLTGTMKMASLWGPRNSDFDRFVELLFQLLSLLVFVTVGKQFAKELPLPVTLKMLRQSLVFPATAGSGPIFRAIRNGHLKDRSAPGEPRIMRSLMQAP
ncbi:uncharacterized protein LOC131178807 [Hevea brasiliensis]|uniref:uncharacterized protein LOC131178807 n=1 Tax=Hevea brasiliensis TaxID=3981 RepID=UPI0025EA2C7A|nr:uncharacterized protein LOC131178807 [Hevea brasiliensis]